MREKNTIEHKGIVEAVENGIITVNVIAQSACASCHVKGSCSVGDIEEKVVEIYSNDKSFTKYEQVMVKLQQSLGFKALFYGYIAPFLLIVIVLIIATEYGLEEGYAGLLSLAPLPIYYYILYLLKDKMKKTFSFSIHKIV